MLPEPPSRRQEATALPVVIGADAGSKAKKAAELGLAVLDEQGWLAMIGRA